MVKVNIARILVQVKRIWVEFPVFYLIDYYKQVVNFVFAYLDVVNDDMTTDTEQSLPSVTFCIPTGAAGNLAAGFGSF